MFIRTETTPNPISLKFLPGCSVSPDRVRDYQSPESAVDSPLAQRLFGIEGVDSVFLGHDFLTITRSENLEWEVLKPFILSTLLDHFTRHLPVIEHVNTTDETMDAQKPLIQRKVEFLLDRHVRPVLARDGGDVRFVRFETLGGILFLELQGACSGCPRSRATLKQGIETFLCKHIEEIKVVQSVD